MLFRSSADADEEQLMEVALEAGAEDVRTEGDKIEVLCDPEAYTSVVDALAAAELHPESKEVTRIPNNTVELDAASARKVFKLLEALDDHDDVQNVSANFSVDDAALAELAED